MGEQVVSSILKCKLKQETPMIHFQYDEAGACLRATELKTKLDSFIKEKYKDVIEDVWYLCREKDGKRTNNALNYKVKIEATGKPFISKDPKDRNDVPINKMYFGNMGDGEKKQTVYYKDDISLTILCFVPSLMVKINECLYEFFLINNFGTRQSKGFGGFRLVEKNNDKINKNPINVLKPNYSYIYVGQQISDYETALNTIQAINAVMKGGINYTYKAAKKPEDRNKYYIKGFIQRRYLDDSSKENIGSDKAFIKHDLIDEKFVKYNGSVPEYNSYEFVRALLGLAEHYEFRAGKESTVVDIENGNIERFRSPITFVYRSNYVIGILNDTYKDMLGQEFNFIGEKGKSSIKVPSEFNMIEFIDGFISYYDEVKSKLANIGAPFNAGEKITITRGGKQ